MGKRLTKKEIFSLTKSDLKNLNRNELSKALSSLRSTAKKRIKRIESAGLDEYMLKNAPSFTSVKGKGKQEIVAEILKTKTFLSSQTSSVSGIKNFQNRLENITGIKNPFKNEKFVSVFNRVKEISDSVKFDNLYTAMKTISDVIIDDENKDVEDVLAEVLKREEEEYEKRQLEMYREYEGIWSELD